MSATVPPTVYRAGWEAAVARRSILTCPYRLGSPEWVAWRIGFRDAEAERSK